MFEALGMAPVLAAVNGATQLGSSFMNARAQDRTNERAEANAWGMFNQQTALANTVHQREVEDMMKAGRNPALSSATGSPTPSGSMPGLQAPNIQMPDILAYGISLKQLEQADKGLAQRDKEIGIKALDSEVGRELTKSKNFNEKYGTSSMIARFMKGLLNEDKESISAGDLQRMFRAMRQGVQNPPPLNQHLDNPTYNNFNP